MIERVELEAIAKLIQTLNYYQILKVSPVASEKEIQEAFHREALSFHPDQYSHSEDEEQKRLAKMIYSKVVEAYRVLSNRRKRRNYDNKLQGIDRIDEDLIDDDDYVTSTRSKPNWATQHPGERFFNLAKTAYGSGDIRSAYMNIQIAIGAEPTNPQYMRFKEKVTAAMNTKKS